MTRKDRHHDHPSHRSKRQSRRRAPDQHRLERSGDPARAGCGPERPRRRPSCEHRPTTKTKGRRMKRAAIYIRYSSQLQKETSLVDQETMCRNFCTRQGWSVVEVFSDKELSGKTRKRPGLTAMLKAANERKFDVLVFEAVDRLARRVSHAITSYDQLIHLRIKMHSVTEGEQDTMSIMLRAWGAQSYAESVAEHTRRGLEQRLQADNRLHSLAYGYMKTGSDIGLNRAINPDHAAIVRRIFEETAQGHSAGAITKALNRDAIPSPTGGKWSESTLRGNVTRGEGILRNRVYLGEARYGRNEASIDPETGAKTIYSTPEKTITKMIPALRIVSDALWASAQDAMARSAHKIDAIGNMRAVRRPALLMSGLMACGNCGQRLIKQGNDYFRCRGSRNDTCDAPPSICQSRIEPRLIARLTPMLLTPDLERAFDEALAQAQANLAGPSAKDRIATLARRRAGAQRKIDNIVGMIADGNAPASLLTRLTELEREIAAIDADAAEVDAMTAASALVPTSSAVTLSRALQRFGELLSQPDAVVEANAFLKGFIDRIIITRDAAAEDKITAEIHMGLGGLLLSAGCAAPVLNLSRHYDQPTAVFRAEPQHFPSTENPDASPHPLPRRPNEFPDQGRVLDPGGALDPRGHVHLPCPGQRHRLGHVVRGQTARQHPRH